MVSETRVGFPLIQGSLDLPKSKVDQFAGGCPLKLPILEIPKRNMGETLQLVVWIGLHWSSGFSLFESPMSKASAKGFLTGRPLFEDWSRQTTMNKKHFGVQTRATDKWTLRASFLRLRSVGQGQAEPPRSPPVEFKPGVLG